MPFLTINGWTIPVQIGSARGNRGAHGELGKSWQGRPGRYRRGLAETLAFTSTVKLDPACADTLEALLDGRGHHIPLDGNFYSTAGLVPQGGLGTYSFPGYVASRPVYGSSHLNLSTGNVIWNPGFVDGKWTVMFWNNVGAARAGADHYVVRGDGAAWLNGVRDDSLVVMDVSVSNGAVQFVTGSYDDIVLLPFNACDEFIDAFTAATVNLGMFFYLPLDEPAGSAEARDLVSGHTGAVTGGTLGVSAQVGTGIEFANVLADQILYPASSDWSASTRGAMSWEAMVKLDALPTVPRFMGNLDSLGTQGWRFQPLAGSTGWRPFAEVQYATTDAAAGADVDLAFGEWHHVIGTWSTDDDTIRLYVDGAEVATYTSQQVGAGGVTTDTAQALYIGGDATANNRNPDGVLDNMAIYNRALTAAEVAERYANVSAGDRHSLGRAFSDAPYLDVGGDILGGREIQMLGKVGGEKVLQHGSAAGWVNNARQVSGALDERTTVKARVAAPDLGYVFSRRYLDGTSLRPVYGEFAGTLQNTPAVDGRPGPFGLGESFGFDDTNAERILLPTDARDALTGQSAITVLAWVRQRNTDDQGVILGLNVNSTPQSLVQFYIVNGSGDLSIGARSRSADSFQSATATGVMDDSEWHHVGGVINLPDVSAQVWLDGELRASAGSFMGWAQTRFSHEQNGNSYIGAHPNGGLAWDGDIAFLGIWYRVLTAAEINNHYLAGLKGLFR